MPLEVSALADEIKPLAIPLGGGTLNVEYYPGRLTRKTQRLLDEKAKAFDAKAREKKPPAALPPNEASETGESDDAAEFEPNAELLCLVLHSWDLVNKGKPVPITVAAFTDFLGYVNTARVARALYRDRDLDPK